LIRDIKYNIQFGFGTWESCTRTIAFAKKKQKILGVGCSSTFPAVGCSSTFPAVFQGKKILVGQGPQNFVELYSFCSSLVNFVGT
jgi:hypothetical protein